MQRKGPRIAVVGGAECDAGTAAEAYEVGRRLAQRGAILLCGGRGGVMERAAAGARSEGGLTLGIMPGSGPLDSPPNPSIDIALYTGLGQARNLVLVLSAEAVIAVGGGWGTLSEIAMALKHQRPVVRLASWSLERPDGRPEPLLGGAGSASEAVDLALAAAARAARETLRE